MAGFAALDKVCVRSQRALGRHVGDLTGENVRGADDLDDLPRGEAFGDGDPMLHRAPFGDQSHDLFDRSAGRD
ncbi:MAG: hypothetical protein AAFZ09_14450, partial [Pseudomonadota bacterium]